MTRTLARDKTWPNAVTVACECGKRLDLLDEQILGMVDNAMGNIQWAHLTNKAGEKANWWWVKCPRCERQRRGREGQLLELLRSARAQGLSRVTLT
jgi:hypothetical protein